MSSDTIKSITDRTSLPANGRIPALVDNTSGKPKRVFEGASMQLYLCAKYDKDHKISFPYDSDEYWETIEWLVWMVSLRFPRWK
jgi:glutathione S-transferase